MKTIGIAVIALLWSAFVLAAAEAVRTFPGLDATNAMSHSVSQESGTNRSAAEAARSFQLKPTPIADAGTQASVEIKSCSLSMHVNHLGPGKYDVAIVRPNGIFQHLGTITIVDPAASPDRQANDNKKEASAHPESVRIETDVHITLPASLSLKQITRVVLLGPGGNAVLDSGA